LPAALAAPLPDPLHAFPAHLAALIRAHPLYPAHHGLHDAEPLHAAVQVAAGRCSAEEVAAAVAGACEVLRAEVRAAAADGAAARELAALVTMGWAPPLEPARGGAAAAAPAEAAAAGGGGGDAPRESMASEDALAGGTPTRPLLPPPLVGAAPVPPVSALADVLTCPVCMLAYFEPISLPECGHSLCRGCALRTLDHKTQCPLCRASAAALVESRTYCYSVDVALLRASLAVAPEDARARAAALAEERAEAADTIPVFVCSLVLPFQECPLHIFEPRYRLMLRRCLQDKTRVFAIAPHVPGAPGGYPPLVTRLRVRSIQLQPDGRSYVNAFADGARYHVIERNVVDGYNVARVKPFVDADEGAELAGLEVDAPLPPPPLAPGLPPHALLRTFTGALSAAAGARTLGDLHAAFGAGLHDMPLDEARLLLVGARVAKEGFRGLTAAGVAPSLAATPQMFLWWLCAALPVQDRTKFEWLTCGSWRERCERVAAFCGTLMEGTGRPEVFVKRLGRSAAAGQCHMQ
jgi:hypothetical protein